jgi:hypothetical protein
MEGWKKALLWVGGAAGVAAVLYYLLREEPEGQAGEAGSAVAEGDDKKVAKAEDVSKEQVLQILNEMVSSQERMRTHMKELTKTLIEKDVKFEETYEKVRSVQPDDPLERHGLSMGDFDQLLSKHQTDPQVMEGISRIMGMADPGSRPGGSVKTADETKVIEVHAFMLQELEGLVRQFKGMKDGRPSWDMKAVTLAAQAVVGAKVEKKFGLTSEEIESAVMKNHTTLATNQEFATINTRMQQTMAGLMGQMP